MSQAQAFDGEFAQELERLQHYSHGDYVEVEIVSVERSEDQTAVVTFDPPLGEQFTIEMDVPIDPSTETEFTKLLRTTGRNFDTASEIVGDRVPAEYTEDGWVIDYPEPDIATTEKVQGAIQNPSLSSIAESIRVIGSAVYFPIVGLVLIPEVANDEVELDSGETEKLGYLATIILYLMGLGIWTTATLLITTLLHSFGIYFPIEVTLGL